MDGIKVRKLNVEPGSSKTITLDSGQFTLGPGVYDLRYKNIGNQIEVYTQVEITKEAPKYMKSPLWKVLNDKVEKKTELFQRRPRGNERNNTEAKESSKKTPENNKGTQKRKWNPFRRMDKN